MQAADKYIGPQRIASVWPELAQTAVVSQLKSLPEAVSAVHLLETGFLIAFVGEFLQIY